MGGVWEWMMDGAYRILNDLLLKTHDSHEVLVMLMSEVMTIMNARPLVFALYGNFYTPLVLRVQHSIWSMALFPAYSWMKTVKPAVFKRSSSLQLLFLCIWRSILLKSSRCGDDEMKLYYKRPQLPQSPVSHTTQCSCRQHGDFYKAPPTAGL